MWDDFQIGDPVDAHSAVGVHGYDISANDCEYWWHNYKYAIGGKINKESEVGRAISGMIAKQADPSWIEDFVFEQALATMRPTAILAMVRRVTQTAFENGRRAKAREVCECLGLNDH